MIQQTTTEEDLKDEMRRQEIKNLKKQQPKTSKTDIAMKTAKGLHKVLQSM